MHEKLINIDNDHLIIRKTDIEAIVCFEGNTNVYTKSGGVSVFDVREDGLKLAERIGRVYGSIKYRLTHTGYATVILFEDLHQLLLRNIRHTI